MSEIDKSNQSNSDKDNIENNGTEIDKPIPSDFDKDNNENTQIETGNEELNEMLNNLPEKEKKMFMQSTMAMLQMSSSN